MTDTPETDDFAQGNHVVPTEFAEQLERERDELISSLNFHADLNKDLIRQRDEAVRSCHIWQTGHAELVAERDFCLQQIDYLLQLNQPERKHIGRWGHNRQEFTSPYINQ
jgi:hypothetical protein